MKRFETFYKYFYVNCRFLWLFNEVLVDFRVAVILKYFGVFLGGFRVDLGGDYLVGCLCLNRV